MTRPARRHFAVDASVARASGSGLPPAPECLRALEMLLRICHRLTLPASLAEEWARHASRAGQRWLKQMHSRRKVENPALRRLEEIRNRLVTLAGTPAGEGALAKDAHLVASAIEHEARVLSLDEDARSRLHHVAEAFGDLRLVLWANPAISVEETLAWIVAGAPDEARRRIGFPEAVATPTATPEARNE